MADEIISKCSNLRITEDENFVVSLEETVGDDSSHALDLAMVGKVIASRSFNFDALKRTMNQIWAISKNALFRQIEEGLFVVQFANMRDRNKVLKGRPWTFDNHLVMLQEIEGEVQPSNIAMTHCPFWLRIYNLPMDCRSEISIRTVAGGLGEVLEVDFDGVGWDKSARVRVMLDITKPLRRVQKIRTRQGSLAILEIKYERLPSFCFLCGVIGHIERDCGCAEEEEETVERQWGAWIRASPRRGRLKIQEETKAFLSCARKIPFPPKENYGEGGEVTTTNPPVTTQVGVGAEYPGGRGETEIAAGEGAKQLHPQEFGEMEDFCTEPEHVSEAPVFSFNATNVKATAPAHRKVKIISRPKLLNSLDTQMEDAGSTIGKRKVDADEVWSREALSKEMLAKKVRSEVNEAVFVNPDSGLWTVEAEIGEDQSRPAL